MVPNDGQIINGMVQIINSVDGSSSLKYRMGMVRWVCTNGMYNMDTRLDSSIVHAESNIDYKQFQHNLTVAAENFQKSLPYFNQLIDTPLTMKRIEELQAPISTYDEKTDTHVQQKSQMDELLGKTMTEAWNEVITTGKVGGMLPIPGMNIERPSLWDGYQVITGLAHLKANPTIQGKLESKANDFASLYLGESLPALA